MFLQLEFNALNVLFFFAGYLFLTYYQLVF
jgi:hypothetical protein